MTRTGRTRTMGFGPALCGVLVAVLALLVASPPAAAANDDLDSLTTVDTVMQVLAQAITHLAEAGFLPRLYTVTGSLGSPASSPGATVNVASIDGTPAASFTAFALGSSQFVSGTTSSGPFSGTGSNRTLAASGQTWMDVDTTFSGPGPFSSVIEDLKLFELIRRPRPTLDASGVQIETSIAGVVQRKTAFSYAYAIRRGLLSGRGTGQSFIPGAPVDRQLVFDVAGDVQGGAGNFAGIAGVLRADERLLLVELSSKGTATGDVTVAPPDNEGKSSCALPGDPDPNKRVCSFIYNENQVVTATATPGAGSKFDRWGDLCKGTKGTVCTFTVVGNFDEVSAKFK